MLNENKTINEKNIEQFKKYKFDGVFNCCLCGVKVYADESYSNKGDRLICHQCHYEKFKNCADARKWMNRK